MASDYLTPYQELLESTRLGDRALEASLATNPLAQRDKAILAGASAPVVAAPIETGVPNPLIGPPVPLSAMPIEKQMAWQDYRDETVKRQLAERGAILDQQAARREQEQKIKGDEQANELIARTPELDPSDVKNYPLLRAKLVRDLSAGSTTERAKNALAPLDAAYTTALSAHTQYKQAEEAAQRAEQKSRLDIARASANERGPEALSQFVEREKTDPEGAIAQELQGGAKTQQRDLEAQLISAGMSQEEVARRFQTPTGFMYGPAKAELKAARTPQQEITDARAVITAYGKRIGPDSLEPLSEEEKQIYQDALTVYNAGLSRSKSRAGVQRDTTDSGAREGESLHRGYRAAPAAQQTAAAKPSPTPPPPPLNPKYPEQWVGGKRYVQMPDGKLYLSKVQ